MSPDNQDPMRILSGRAAIGMAVFVLLAYVAFQAFGKHLEVETWLANMITGAFLTVTYFYWRKGKSETDRPSSYEQQGRRCFVLHVEDNPVNRKILSYAFKKLDLDVDLQTANSGEEALEYLTRSDFLRIKPDIIIVDLKLAPGMMTGQEFMEKIKTNSDLFEIPIIILSSIARDAAERPEILDTCRFYIERKDGMEALKEAILSCDPRNGKTAFEEISNKYEEVRKINHELRNVIATLMAAHNMTDVEWQSACKLAQGLLMKASNLSGRFWINKRAIDDDFKQ